MRVNQDLFEKKCLQYNSNNDEDEMVLEGAFNDVGLNFNQNQGGFFNNIRNPNRLVKYTIISFISGLFIGIIICASILLALFFVWYLNNTFATHSIVSKYLKPTQLWDEKETFEWLQQLGPWSMTQIAPVALKLKLSIETFSLSITHSHNLSRLDGTNLLELDESKLVDEPFNLTDKFYRELFIDSINALKFGFGMPIQNLWEFKVNIFLPRTRI